MNRVELVKRVGVRARETDNIVERLRGTLKDRLKPMGGLKNMNTAQAVLNGYVTHYNFCRKHLTLGKTPAEASGISIKGWNELIDQAQIQKTMQEIPQKQIMGVKVRR